MIYKSTGVDNNAAAILLPWTLEAEVCQAVRVFAILHDSLETALLFCLFFELHCVISVS